MGGRIEVQAVEKAGATFILTLPTTTAKDGAGG
jgi:chemotaxis protein histidine kinase CheA